MVENVPEPRPTVIDSTFQMPFQLWVHLRVHFFLAFHSVQANQMPVAHILGYQTSNEDITSFASAQNIRVTQYISISSWSQLLFSVQD